MQLPYAGSIFGVGYGAGGSVYSLDVPVGNLTFGVSIVIFSLGVSFLIVSFLVCFLHYSQFVSLLKKKHPEDLDSIKPALGAIIEGHCAGI